MHRTCSLIISLLTFIVMSASISSLHAKTLSAPVVYSDNYIDVRSAVLFTEEWTFHVGDVLYLVINLEFEPQRIRVINLDETLLKDSWGTTAWIAPRGGPSVRQVSTAEGMTRLEALYEFQIINCPDLTERCPGGKIYTLDDIGLGIEILDDDGRVISNTDINFQPSPGYVSLASAVTVINGRVESFNFYFPRRAFGTPVLEEVNAVPSLAIFLTGLLIILSMVVAPAAREWLRHRMHTGVGLLGNRWELVLDRLHDESLANEEFWEGVRVAITWYCFDEFKINPVDWVEGQGDYSGDDILDQLQAIYHQSMTAPELEKTGRNEIVTRLTDIIKQG